MFIFTCLALVTALTTHVRSEESERIAPARIAVTNHVLPLVAANHPFPVTPSSKHLHKRRPLQNAILPLNTSSTTTSVDDETISKIQQDVLTLGGRVYMTNVTLAGKEYTLVIDTGSSDTWIACSTFECLSRYSKAVLPQEECGFGALYDKEDSTTFVPIPRHTFGVRYTDGEFLLGELGTEVLGIGALEGGAGEALNLRQTIGVVERGWWSGDGISSGLMGLAYPTLASDAKELNYSSVVFSLFEDGSVPSVFSLALSRPTIEHPAAGGLLAIGGIPDVKHDAEFVSVPIRPVKEGVYSFYAVLVEGFDIAPPSEASPSPSPSPLVSEAASPSSSSSTPSMSFDLISETEIGIPIAPPGPLVSELLAPFLFPFEPPSSMISKTKTSTPTSAPSPATLPTTSTTTRKKAKPTTRKPKKPHPSKRPPLLHPPPARQATRPENADPNSTIIFVPNLTMVIDSGCTLLYLPDDIADRIASLFVPRAVFASNTNSYLVPCSALAPRVGVVIGGRSFYIHEDDLMNKAPGAVGGGGVVDGENGDREGGGGGAGSIEEGSGVFAIDADGVMKKAGRLCTLAVQRQGNGDAVLGDSWLKNVLAVFDLGRNEMRFAGREEY